MLKSILLFHKGFIEHVRPFTNPVVSNDSQIAKGKTLDMGKGELRGSRESVMPLERNMA